MTDERADLMLEILKGLQSDVSSIRRDISSLNLRMSALEDHVRGLVTSTYMMQNDISDLKDRVDRIERRLGLTDTEH